MTPAARIAAAADILDQILAGGAAEKLLTGWGRRTRYAGSGDRAAVRDLVYTSLRRRGRHALAAGLDGASDPALTGRALMIGALVAKGCDPDAIFTGKSYAPAALDRAEHAALTNTAQGQAMDDFPAWLHAPLMAALGDDLAAYAQAMTQRAPVWLRVNLLRGDRDKAQALLAADGIMAETVPALKSALKVVEGERRIAQSKTFLTGVVELQDLSPQRAVSALGGLRGMTVLDFCAGGGGKALALAAQGAARIVAHDVSPRRMTDLPARARRAGANIAVSHPVPDGRFDLVVADVPCSGSGTWARDPAARWLLTPADLARLNHLQDGILDAARQRLAQGGRLAYMTCSVLREENEDRVNDFCIRTSMQVQIMQRYGPPDPGDGFFLAILTQ